MIKPNKPLSSLLLGDRLKGNVISLIVVDFVLSVSVGFIDITGAETGRTVLPVTLPETWVLFLLWEIDETFDVAVIVGIESVTDVIVPVVVVEDASSNLN